jgi:hypothetical protein
MYYTIIHGVAYQEDFFIAKCQAAYMSILLTEKIY